MKREEVRPHAEPAARLNHGELAVSNRSSTTEGWMDELHPVSFLDLHRSEVFAINKPAVNLYDHGRVVLVGAVEQLLNRNFAAIGKFGKSVEDESHERRVRYRS